LASSSLFLDPWLIPQGDGLRTLAESVAERAERGLTNRLRSPRKDAALRRRRCVGNLLANIAYLTLNCHLEPGTRLAAATAKTKPSRYHRADYPRHLLAPLLEHLEDEGLIIRHPYVFKQRLTTLEPTPAFANLLAHHAVTMGDIDREPGGESIWLRARTGEEQFGREPPPKTLIPYQETSESLLLREQVEQADAFLRGADIRLDSGPYAPFALRRMFLLRHPGDPESFTLNGRLAGGWWMDLPSKERHLVTIGGEDIADLDYAAMFAHLAYLRIGAGFPKGDLYEVPGLEEHRAAAKVGLLSLLSRSSDMQRLASDLKALLPDGWTAGRLMEAMTKRHPRIAHLFGSDVGIDLMFQESTILMDLLKRLERQGVPALPFHDGIAVPTSAKGVAASAMEEASRAALGVPLPVKEKTIWRPAASAA
jgi:hypothetical protein